MEVRGTAVRATPLFVKQRFPERLEQWLAALGEKARAIMSHKIDTSAWYPLADAMIEPTRSICELFYGGREEGAWEVGRFSADYSLWGLYRLFVKIGSPFFLINRGTEAFNTYYRPARLVVVERAPFRAMVRIELFPQPHRLVECRIGGWMRKGLEISGCHEVRMSIQKSLAAGDDCTELVAEWA